MYLNQNFKKNRIKLNIKLPKLKPNFLKKKINVNINSINKAYTSLIHQSYLHKFNILYNHRVLKFKLKGYEFKTMSAKHNQVKNNSNFLSNKKKFLDKMLIKELFLLKRRQTVSLHSKKIRSNILFTKKIPSQYTIIHK